MTRKLLPCRSGFSDMRPLLYLLIFLFAAMPARAEPPGQRFVSIAFHNIVDDRDELDTDAVTAKTLIQFLDWLKGSGWTAVSLDDLAAAARGDRRLPDKTILLTFDDGFRSLYTRAFPLLKAYRYPAVAALVGSWMEDRPDGMVQYGDKMVSRSKFVSWDEAREMQASGLVEFASHSYDLHHGIQANPQGNQIPSAVTRRYDPATRTYEDDAQYSARIRADLMHSRAVMAAKLGHPPRAMVWPYGRYTGLGLAVTKEIGFRFSVTLEAEPAYTSDLFAIHRYFPSQNASLGDIVGNLRFEPASPLTRRIACLTLDALAAAGSAPVQDQALGPHDTLTAARDGPVQDQALGHVIEGIRSLGADTVVIDANAALPSADAPIGAVFFPTKLRPLRADILSRLVWQIRSRGGASVYLHLPLAAAAAALGDSDTPALFADMARYTQADGMMIDMQPSSGPRTIVGDLPGEIRARRAALSPVALDHWGRLGLASYRAAAAINPRLRLMLPLNAPGGPPDWADIGLLPPIEDAGQIAAVAERLRTEGWLRPDVVGRVVFSLPSERERQIEALRLAQRQGATAFALCPGAPALPPTPALAAAFSAATYPHKP
jgi:peptidoglycan/xylan/chitin deacetylase (PgdA/CDA1 family)